MKKLRWYLKQLFPLWYASTYIEDGRRMVTVWQMWLGRCYNIRNYEVVNDLT